MQNASTWGRRGKVDKHEHTEYKEHLSQIRQVSVSAVPGAHHANGWWKEYSHIHRPSNPTPSGRSLAILSLKKQVQVAVDSANQAYDSDWH